MSQNAPSADDSDGGRRVSGTWPEGLVRQHRSWRSALETALVTECGEREGRRLFSAYGDAFSFGYQEDMPVARAVDDITRLDRHRDELPLGIVYRGVRERSDVFRFSVCWSAPGPLLQSALPIFESLGLPVADHRSYAITPADGAASRIDDFGLVLSTDAAPIAELKQLVEEAFAAMWGGRTECDGFNRLVLAAQIGWREASVVRAAYRYLRQTSFALSQPYVEQTLVQRPEFVRLLLGHFRSRFDPAMADRGVARQRDAELVEALKQVTGLDEDRTLRTMLAFFRAVVRTNYYQHDGAGAAKDYLSFKIDPGRIPAVAPPRPNSEMFVCSPRMEGLHVRAAKIARGGLRWSDRPEDFRSEVLALMKAQTVKNAVIVPDGAKGAFVVKRARDGLDRDQLDAEVRDCYSTFVRGLLDLTDNLVDAAVVAPPEVVVHDEHDPYLVVAADKGTAALSDLANSIAAEYGFWMGDAFASGGSTGYDHKAMGVTAQGAWISVRRHFEEMGVDVGRDAITVVGIGDMSGDVFGATMLRSRNIRLIGAFDHRHVFLDPDPDPVASYAERERLARLPASSWGDYDRAVISAGGGVFSRSTKSVPLPSSLRGALGVEQEWMAPPDVIRALLRAPVDLLFNGGIGTFVKAGDETDVDAADPVNDTVRVDAGELSCRVVAEGGNLGLTQRARIEFALAGGRINTDFIDNSAGVDTSDREVNLKLLLDTILAHGETTRAERDDVLARLSEEVVAAVLEDNRLQTQVLSVIEARAPLHLDQHAQAIQHFEGRENLDRAVECLPDEQSLGERRRAGLGLTRPEIAVLLAYAKNNIVRELSESDLVRDPYLSGELHRYLPAGLGQRFADRMDEHPLRREIIKTTLSNDLVNHVGTGFFYRLEETTGVGTPDAVRAYVVVRDVFGLNDLWSRVEALGVECPADTRIEMLEAIQQLARHCTLWFLRNRRPPLDIATEVGFFRPPVVGLASELPACLAGPRGDAVGRAAARWASRGVPQLLANRIAALIPLAPALDLVEIARACDRHVGSVCSVYSRLEVELRLDWLQNQIVELPSESHWELLAKASLRDDLFVQRRRLTTTAVSSSGEPRRPDRVVDDWLRANEERVERFRATLEELRTTERLDVAMLAVALQNLRNLA